jgi:hypothetical protein
LLEKAAQLDLRRQEGLHPLLGSRLEMPPEFQEAQLTPSLHPSRRTELRTEGIIEEHEEHPPIQITYGGVFCGRLQRGSMERAFPGLNNQRHLPADRIDPEDRLGRPNRRRHMGDTASPGQQGHVGLGRSIAFFRRVFPGPSPP